MSLAKLIAAKMLGTKASKLTRGPTVVSETGQHAKKPTLSPRTADQSLVAELESALASATPAPATPPPPSINPGWRGSCKAIDAETGRRCRLPAHPGEAHRHERGPFFRIATPSQTHFPHRAQLDTAATRHSNPTETP